MFVGIKVENFGEFPSLEKSKYWSVFVLVGKTYVLQGSGWSLVIAGWNYNQGSESLCTAKPSVYVRDKNIFRKSEETSPVKIYKIITGVVVRLPPVITTLRLFLLIIPKKEGQPSHPLG